IELAVSIEVRRDRAALEEPGNRRPLLKGALPAAEQNGNLVGPIVSCQVVDLPVAIEIADGDRAAERIERIAAVERPRLGLALVQIEHAAAVVPRTEEIDLSVLVDVPGK